MSKQKGKEIPTPCQDCGSDQWEAAAVDENELYFYQCDQCCDWDEDTQEWVRKNLQ